MNIFSQILKKGLAKGKETLITSSSQLQTVGSALRKLKDIINDSSNKQDALLGALTFDPEYISDDVVSAPSVSYSKENMINVSLSDPKGVELSANLHQVLGDISDTGSATLTDANGRMYNIIDKTEEQFYIEGNRILFATNAYASSTADALLYVDSQGGYHLNNAIKTADFVKREAERIEPSNLLDYTRSMRFMMDGEMDLNAPAYYNLYAWSDSGSSSILGQLNDQLTHWGLATHDNIMDACHALWSHINIEIRPLPTPTGKVSTLWDIVSDELQSRGLNKAIAATISFCLNAKEQAEDLLSYVSSRVQTEYACVKQFLSQASNAFTTGGFYGLAMFIIIYVKGITTLSADDDGMLSFTENSRYSTTIYLAGLVSGIFSVVDTLATVIASVFAPAIGMVIGVVGSLATGIIKSVGYKYDSDTLSQIIEDVKVLKDMAPYGLFQTETNDLSIWDDIIDTDVAALMMQSGVPVVFEIPGGYVIISGLYDDNGELIKFRSECHPSISNPNEAFQHIVDYLFNHDMVVIDANTDSSKWLVDVLANTEGARNNLLSCWYLYKTPCNLVNDGNGYLDIISDRLLTEYVAKNIFIMSVAYIAFCSATVPAYDVKPVVEALVHNWSPFWLIEMFDANHHTVTFQAGGSTESHTFGYGQGHVGNITWTDVYDKCVKPVQSVYGDPFYFISQEGYFNEPEAITDDFTYAINIPKYDRMSYWLIIGLGVAITALATVAVIATTFKVKKAIDQKKSIQQAKVAQAYQNLQDNPNSETYNAYRKAVKRNNLWATLLGGDKFNTVSYWDGAVNQDKGSPEGSVLDTSGVNGLMSKFIKGSDLDQTPSSNDYLNKGENFIAYLIRGTYD